MPAEAGAASEPPRPAKAHPPSPKSITPPGEEAQPVGKAAEYLRPFLRDPDRAPDAAAGVIAAVNLYSGPLPHPDDLARYDALIPNGARTILDMAMREQAHRHKMQSLEMIYPYLGWASGSVGFLASVVGAIYLGINVHDGLAVGLLGIPVLGVVGWFIHARVSTTATATEC
jgi:uncharacterized membrane protein